MASAALLLPVILFSLVTSTFSLSCMECSGMDSKSCTGTSVSCHQDHDVCVAILESNIKDGSETTRYRQVCGTKSMCTYSGSLTMESGAKKVSSSCCYTNNCTPPTPKLPTDKPEKNGHTCNSCTSGEGKCETLYCTGEENKCVIMTTTTTKGQNPPSKMTVDGCGTSAWCDKDRQFQYGADTIEISVACRGDSAPPPALPLLLLAAIFIMKVIS